MGCKQIPNETYWNQYFTSKIFTIALYLNFN